MWTKYGFQKETTLDGSPTLRLINTLPDGDFRPESMHHSGGAFSETEFIYGTLAQLVFDQVKEPQFLCVGLGLGYIEMQVALKSLQKPQTPIKKLLSFESEENLKKLFINWLQDLEIPEECQQTYNLAAAMTVANTGFTIQQLKLKLLAWWKNSTWVLEGPLTELFFHQQKQGRFHGIFYDAFSRKTTEGLWSEAFLNEFLVEMADSQSALATYACLGNLKRALKQQNFELIVRPGFLGKRNSTLGLRGLTLN